MSQAFATPIPLAADAQNTGRTNHPVLFVHGLGDDASGAWGANVAEISQSCVSQFFLDKPKFVSNGYAGNPLSSMPLQNWSVEVYDHGCKGNDQSFTFTIPGQNPGQSPSISLSGDNVLCDNCREQSDYTLRKNISRGKDYNLVSSYKSNTLADVLASQLSLNTQFKSDISQSKTGINDNGLYFYNARKSETTTQTIVTQNPSTCNVKWDLVVYQPGTPSVTSLGTPGSSMTSVYSSVSWSLKGQCDNKTETTSGTISLSTNGATELASNNPSTSSFCIQTQHGIITSATGNVAGKSISYDICGKPNSRDLSSYFNEIETKLNSGTPSTTTTTTSSTKLINELDGFAPLDWTNSNGIMGQSQQLYLRLQEVLDQHYGSRATWVNDPNAVIDIVTHSQGGLVTREMIRYINQDASLSISPANPVNHINRIININTPHLGSALATESVKSKIASPYHLQSYPQLAYLRAGFTGEDPNRKIVDGLNLTVTGSYLGPYTLNADFGKAGTYNWNLVIPNDIQAKLDSTKHFIQDFSTKSKHLAWDSPLIARLNNNDGNDYPIYSNSKSPIPMVNLYSSKSGVRFENIADELRNGISKKVDELAHNASNGSGFWGIAKDFFIDSPKFAAAASAEFLVWDDVSQLKKDLKTLDQEWSNDGDAVVETPSQKGIDLRNPSKWQMNEFHAIEFRSNQGHVAHIGSFPKMLTANSHYLPLAATAQSTDIIPQLLTADYAYTQNITPNSTNYAGLSVLARRIPQNSPSQVEVELNIQNQSSQIIQTPKVNYLYRANPNFKPQFKATGLDVQAQTQNLGGGLFLATLSFTKDFIPKVNSSIPQADVKLSLRYTEPLVPWTGLDDPSFPLDTQWQVNNHIELLSQSDTLWGQLDSNSGFTKLNLSNLDMAYAMTQERDQTGQQSQPLIRVVNAGEKIIQDLDLFYFHQNTDHFQLRSYWQPNPPATVRLVDTLTAWGPAVKMSLRGMNLQPGQNISDLGLEFNRTDWSLWDKTLDPSYNGSQTAKFNPYIMILNTLGQRIFGESPKSTAQLETSQTNTPPTPAQCAQAKPLLADAKCQSLTIENGKLYQCISSAEGCGLTQNLGVFCSNISPSYPYWGTKAWQEVGLCP